MIPAIFKTTVGQAVGPKVKLCGDNSALYLRMNSHLREAEKLGISIWYIDTLSKLETLLVKKGIVDIGQSPTI